MGLTLWCADKVQIVKGDEVERTKVDGEKDE